MCWCWLIFFYRFCSSITLVRGRGRGGHAEILQGLYTNNIGPSLIIFILLTNLTIMFQVIRQLLTNYNLILSPIPPHRFPPSFRLEYQHPTDLEIFCQVRGWIGVTIGKIFVLVYFIFLGIWIILGGIYFFHQIYLYFYLTLP